MEAECHTHIRKTVGEFSAYLPQRSDHGGCAHGYGKTTAVNWYLVECTRTETLKVIRISVYSDNLAIFWRSVQDAFALAGFVFLRDYICPE